MTPILLTDKNRLQEIYDLRLTAWENSDRKGIINRRAFPEGWSEGLDQDAYHFVVFDDRSRIVATARLSLHGSLQELPYPSAFQEFKLKIEKNFAFYSRLVVSPTYRGCALVRKLDLARIAFLKENKIPFAIATCQERRLRSLLSLGFEILGRTQIDYAGIGEETAVILKTNNVAIDGQ